MLKNNQVLTSFVIPTRFNHMWIKKGKGINNIRANTQHRNQIILSGNRISNKAEFMNFCSRYHTTGIIASKESHLSKAVYEGFKLAKGDYLCFMHDDLIINKFNWIDSLIDILQDKKIGIIGISFHSFAHLGRYKNFESVVWSDRIMFMRRDVADKCTWDIRYKPVESESPDYCLQAIENGYVNIKINYSNIHKHPPKNFTRKETENVKKSVALIRKKWKGHKNPVIRKFIEDIMSRVDTPQD